MKEPSVAQEKESALIHDKSNTGLPQKIQPFSVEDLVKSWRKFVDKIDAPQLKSALSTREPVIQDQWIVSYELDNELQLQRLTLDLKPKLLGYLRRHLNNDAIDIKFSVLPHHDTDSSVPFTDSEKWQALIEKYPSLAYLKTKFGLDFE